MPFFEEFWDESDFEEFDINDFWAEPDDDTKKYIGQPLTDELIRSVEEKIGYKLPESYIALMRVQNGGRPKRPDFVTCDLSDIILCIRHPEVPTVWFATIETLFSVEELPKRCLIGGVEIGIIRDNNNKCGSIYFDYRVCGPHGDPCVRFSDFVNGSIVIDVIECERIIDCKVSRAHFPGQDGFLSCISNSFKRFPYMLCPEHT